MKKTIQIFIGSFCFLILLLIGNGYELMALTWDKIPVITQVIESQNYPVNTKYGTKTQTIKTMNIQYQYKNTKYSIIKKIDINKIGFELISIRVNPKNPNNISFYNVNWFFTLASFLFFVIFFILGLINIFKILKKNKI